MIVLGIDTATPGLSVALAGPDGVLASFEAGEGRRHTELLAPAIAEICRSAGLALADVEAIAVDVGPGLFTGLRVGLATAGALASALERPALGVISTDVLAEAYRSAGRHVVAVVDVRRSEVAWAAYGPLGAACPTGPALARPDELRQVLVGLAAEVGEVLVVGDGALRYRDILVPPSSSDAAAGEVGRVELEVAAPFPSARVLAQLARRRLLDGASTAGGIAPRYLRQADVRIGWASHDLPAGVTSHAATAGGART
jgi:tRNA threonylcarbamoyladenosine biosynthesis protein TsaB